MQKLKHLLGVFLIFFAIAIPQASADMFDHPQRRDIDIGGMSLMQVYQDGKLVRIVKKILSGNAEVIDDYILMTGDIDYRGVNGISLLYFAFEEREIEVFEAILKAGASPNLAIGCNGQKVFIMNKFENCNYTSVMHLAILENIPEYLEVALRYGGDVNLREGNHSPLLYYAFLYDNFEAVEILNQYGVDKNILIIGRINRPIVNDMLVSLSYKACKWLILNGADLDKVDEKGRNMEYYIEFLKKYHQDETQDSKDYQDFVEFFITHQKQLQ